MKHMSVLSLEACFIKLRFLPRIRNADFWNRVACVVGAGISGLRCAEVLAQQGLKVTILEGRDRIGGRVGWSSWLRRRSGAHIHQIHQSSQQGRLIDLYILHLSSISR